MTFEESLTKPHCRLHVWQSIVSLITFWTCKYNRMLLSSLTDTINSYPLLLITVMKVMQTLNERLTLRQYINELMWKFLAGIGYGSFERLGISFPRWYNNCGFHQAIHSKPQTTRQTEASLFLGWPMHVCRNLNVYHPSSQVWNHFVKGFTSSNGIYGMML